MPFVLAQCSLQSPTIDTTIYLYHILSQHENVTEQQYLAKLMHCQYSFKISPVLIVRFATLQGNIKADLRMFFATTLTPFF